MEGNERADRAAKDAAELPPLMTTRSRFSLAYLRRGATDRMTRRWIEDTRARGSGGQAFPLPDRRSRPGIRPRLRATRKGAAARFFQLLSRHAMTAPYLKEMWGWVDTDRCWWCDGGRQSREHLFRECGAWKEEIKELWEKVGNISGKRDREEGRDRPFKSRRCFGFHVRQARARPNNTTVRELLSNDRYTEAVLEFLGSTRVGEVKAGVICR